MAVVAKLRKTEINLEDNLEDRCNYVPLSAQVKISILSSQTLVHCYHRMLLISVKCIHMCAIRLGKSKHFSFNQMLSVLLRLHRESKKLVQYNLKAT